MDQPADGLADHRPVGGTETHEWNSISLNNAGKSLEDAFFAKEDARLLAQLRAKVTRDERRKALRDVIMVQDEGLVDHLLDLGINPETVLAVTLIPLAMVAWADGSIEPKEREAIQRSAAEKGIAPGSVAEKVLNTWLTDPLGADLVDTWKTLHSDDLADAHPARSRRGSQDGTRPGACGRRSGWRLPGAWTRVTNLGPGKGSARRPGEAAGRLIRWALLAVKWSATP